MPGRANGWKALAHAAPATLATLATKVTLPAVADVPKRLQVYRPLRAAIEQGSFAPGSRLPPTREHAQMLGGSRNTVLWARDRLQAAAVSSRW